MKEPIRILQIVPNMQQGGLENFIMNLYRDIDKEKVQFDFLVHYKGKKFFDDEIEKLGGKIYRFSLRDNNNLLKYMIELNNFYKEHKEYKVIHCHMSSVGFINFLIAKKNGIEVRIAHSHNSSTDCTLKGKMKRLMMLPYKYVTTENFACSSEAGKYLYGNKKFEVIPNAIDTTKFKFNEEVRAKYRKKLKIEESKFVIGHVGRFNIQKNHRFIINLFNEYLQVNQNALLLLIGDGELFENIKKMCNDLKIIDKVIFLGNVDNPYYYYNVMDLFILPSLFEGLPVVGIEAQTNGVNCLFADNITKEVAITELIEYLELNNKIWINKIEEKCKNKNLKREKYYKIIENSEFEIRRLSKEMEKRYIDYYND